MLDDDDNFRISLHSITFAACTRLWDEIPTGKIIGKSGIKASVLVAIRGGKGVSESLVRHHSAQYLIVLSGCALKYAIV